MGLLDKFERGLERAVRSAFSAGGTRDVKPVEVAHALRLAMDDESMVLGEGRTLAPNVYTVQFSAADFPRARKWGAALAEELCDEAIRYAREQGYTLPGAVRVSFVQEQSLRAGELHVESEVERSEQPPAEQDHLHDDAAPAPAASAPVPAPAPAPAPVSPRRTVDPVRRAPMPPEDAQRHRHPPAAATQALPSRGAAPLQPVLEISGRKFALNHDSIVLGRSPDADILVEDTGVSRRHLEIITRGRTVTAVDLGSTNGFTVNGRRVDGSTVLRDGDRLLLGRVEMVFRLLPARSQDTRQDLPRGGRR